MKNKKYIVQFKVTVYTDVTISAESLTDAIEQGGEFEVTDLVNVKGGHIDSEVQVSGVFIG